MDPIGFAGGAKVYGFASGDPINYADPSGLCQPCGAEMAGMLTQLSAVSKDLKTILEVAIVVTFAPVVIVAGAESAGASAAVSVGTNAQPV